MLPRLVRLLLLPATSIIHGRAILQQITSEALADAQMQMRILAIVSPYCTDNLPALYCCAWLDCDAL